MHLLVTGGSRGIGAAVVRAATAAGHRVTFTYVERADAAEALVAETGARAVRHDVAELDRAAALLDEVGPIEGLVNNAGITGGIAPFVDTGDDVLRRVFDVNVLGLLALTREAVRRWSGGGVVVNLGSVAARTGSPSEYVAYAASKAAVHALTVGLGRELAPAGVRVVCVSPGITDTEIHAAGGEPDRAARLAPRIPAGRPGQPEEVAAAVLWALSDEAGYVTATTIEVTGGL